MKNVSKTAKAISYWMKHTSSSAGVQGGVFGVSGGLDSALVVALAKEAWQDNCLGLVLPCYSAKTDIEDAIEILQHFDCKYKVLDLAPLFDSFINMVGGSKDDKIMANANLKPRLRMTTLYYYANLMNYIVVGTTNQSEYFVGYFTKYGDGGVDLLPLIGLTKYEVRQLSKHYGISEKILAKQPSGGLWEGQTDEQEMGVSYEHLDAYLRDKEIPKDAEAKILQMHKKSAHKRNLPPNPILCERNYNFKEE